MILPIQWTGTRKHAQGSVSGLLLYAVHHVGGATPFRLTTTLPLPLSGHDWACRDPEEARARAADHLARFVALLSGFTREDVANLRQAAETIEADYRVWKPGREDEAKYVADLRSLADRIERLLPPESP